jgi:hypothetical protein
VNLARTPEQRSGAAQRILAFAARRRAREGKSTVFQASFRPRRRRSNVKVIYTRCGGLDVHKTSVHVCIREDKGKKVAVATRVFGTFTADLEQLRALLREHKVGGW